MTLFLGLTGSIGMGKSVTADMFAEAGVPVYNADAAVHALYAKGGAAVQPIADVFPDVIVDAAVARPLLRERVLKEAKELAKLNAIVHPLVANSQLAFRQSADVTDAALAVLDIPLLYETGGDKACDYVAVVSAPAHIQRARVLERDTMDEAEFEAILAKQLPDAEKRAKADFIISSAFGFEFARAHVSAIIDLIQTLDKKEA